MKRVIDSDLEFLTTREAAAILRLSPRTMEGMRRNGKGPAFTTLGNDQNSKVVYRREDIDLWLRGKRHRQVVPRSGSRADLPSGHFGLSADVVTSESGQGENWITLWLAQTDAPGYG